MGNVTDHATTALTVVVITTLTFHFSPVWILHVGLYLLGNLFPDIDHVGSRIHRGLLIPRLYGRRFKHWGRCHSVAGGLLFSIPILLVGLGCWLMGWVVDWWSPLVAAGAFFAGQITHLLTDEGFKSKGNKRRAFKWWA